MIGDEHWVVTETVAYDERRYDPITESTRCEHCRTPLAPRKSTQIGYSEWCPNCEATVLVL